MDLFEKILGYANDKKYYAPRGLLLERMLRKKVAEKFIINKFLETWIIRNQDDPMDILDDLILKYSLWETNAKQYDNKPLLDLYSIYIKTLMSVKNYIKKELQL